MNCVNRVLSGIGGEIRPGIVHRLELYSTETLAQIVRRSANILEIEIDEESSIEIARRSRGTPRIANRLLKRVRDYALVRYDSDITEQIANEALDLLKIDCVGLNSTDSNLLKLIIYYNALTITVILATSSGRNLISTV